MRIIQKVFIACLLPVFLFSLCAAAFAEGSSGGSTIEITVIDSAADLPETEAEKPAEAAPGEEAELPLVAPGEVLSYGDQGEAVTRLQQRLLELGYYSGKITGNYLGGTRSSVKKFQQDNRLAVTGKVDAETAEALQKAEYRALAYGDDGNDVTRLQQRLIELGYLNAKATGKYRGATESAVSQFQLELRALHGGIARGVGDLFEPQVVEDAADAGLLEIRNEIHCGGRRHRPGGGGDRMVIVSKCREAADTAALNVRDGTDYSRRDLIGAGLAFLPEGVRLSLQTDGVHQLSVV